MIEQYLEDPLAEKLLLNPTEGRRCLVTVQDGAAFIDRRGLSSTKDKDKQRSKVAGGAVPTPPPP